MVCNEFVGGTESGYQAVRAAISQSGSLPSGHRHWAGPSENGWIVCGLWDSREQYEAFRDAVLMPALGGLGEAGFPGPPRVTSFEVSAQIT